MGHRNEFNSVVTSDDRFHFNLPFISGPSVVAWRHKKFPRWATFFIFWHKQIHQIECPSELRCPDVSSTDTQLGLHKLVLTLSSCVPVYPYLVAKSSIIGMDIDMTNTTTSGLCNCSVWPCVASGLCVCAAQIIVSLSFGNSFIKPFFFALYTLICFFSTAISLLSKGCTFAFPFACYQFPTACFCPPL